MERFVHFTANDYRSAAMGCRAAAVIADADAAKAGNSGIVQQFKQTAEMYRTLAQKLELAARVL